MDKELSLLETRLADLLDEYQRLCKENHVLQERVTVLEGENRRLADKVDTAIQRVEAVLVSLPGSEMQ